MGGTWNPSEDQTEDQIKVTSTKFMGEKMVGSKWLM